MEELKLRLENFVRNNPPRIIRAIALQGWFKAMVTQTHLILIVFNLEVIWKQDRLRLWMRKQASPFACSSHYAKRLLRRSIWPTDCL